PNIARLLASVGQYIYSKDEDTIYVHLFVGSEADCELAEQQVSLTQRTEYPWKETVEITVRTETEVRFTLAIRVPGWCKDAEVTVNGEDVKIAAVSRKGYARITRLWRSGDRVEILLPMPIERIHAHPAVRANAGKVAIQRGPVVYCLEEVDNGPNLPDLSLPQDAKLTLGACDQSLGGVLVIHGVARRSTMTSQWKDVLYSPVGPKREEVAIKAIPYFAWGNRQPGEMLVWIQEDL
ncbi:glycoside hydrolase family 127 protein, partial [Candidatus Bipolaricaulota bacterium]|nr:glycoside hydrolase family 127 protein [Candidatus Bipolaricaulota bacterium]